MRKKTRDFHNLSRGTNLIFNLIAGVFAFLCVYPFLFVIVISLTNEEALARNGYSIFPEKWSFSAYEYIFKAGDQLLRSYGVTILITVVGTLISLAVICLYAYAISRKNFQYRGFFSFIAFFTMLFNGGLVPTYMVLTQVLHLKDTIWALILPLIMNAFYVLIMRTFYNTTVPDAIIESAKIDGAGELRAFITIVLPISLPGIATIGLFATLGFWNDWFNALLYIDNPALVPLQSMLMRIENSMQFLLNNAQLNASGQTLELMRTLPQESTRMALVVLATLPIACAYPFFQRYFVQGLTIGAVKE
ncbi:carbohydrate ABC transporter permease [Paenibacillus dendritiformis]|uniref:Binding-protein-dependent transport systems inner membrane component n=1 Tax=Paenibacillus dendritiformis C454 TaxID=1131935 RepID=H3SLY1_9BACL|nr:carbohydrate ABC transporter permease [Paenibacillus dendritiformis]EHQ59930.1 binding-protein-dependent transport systems inner membrane component [Paenibacillus dendritiformis C454]MBG9792136.1 sugar ABC transporter permease [Paenibacillus dendritiformis]MDU5142393.1 carbohydrate ABC transporter permease [Paenibacillus dendritiformis]NKI21049.1 carbohydrate ABC transporter permease [Paenibacillus dendritiformis]NRF98166.1 carbohydrate ABC transporter permease [Paenibacillus dendritiformis